MDTLKLLKVYSRHSVVEMHHKMPPEVVSALMTANNRMLKAAIIENGGQLTITPESFYEMFHNKLHVVASSDEDGNIKLSLAGKETVNHPESELMPL